MIEFVTSLGVLFYSVGALLAMYHCLIIDFNYRSVFFAGILSWIYVYLYILR